MFLDRGMLFEQGLTDIARWSAYPERAYDIYGNLLVFRKKGFFVDTSGLWWEGMREHVGMGKDTERGFAHTDLHGIIGEFSLYLSRYAEDGPVEKKNQVSWREGMYGGLWPELDYYFKQIVVDKLQCRSWSS